MLHKIETAIQDIFGNEFSLTDMCMRGSDLWFGPTEVEIFSGFFIIPLGPIPVPFCK